MRVAWATDVHFDFVDEAAVDRFCRSMMKADPGALLLGGDIADAESLVPWLRFLEERLPIPIHFVLGNHDFYLGSVAGVRRSAGNLQSDRVAWLPRRGVVELTPEVGLVGHDGWGDGRLADPRRSSLLLNDFLMITELREACGGLGSDGRLADPEGLRDALARLGDDAATTLEPHVVDAAGRYANVIVLTHVPPFRETCLYQGRPSGDEGLPFFSCGAVGELLRQTAAAYPDVRFTVLSGHTHDPGEARVLPNLVSITAGAVYGKPRFRMLELPVL